MGNIKHVMVKWELSLVLHTEKKKKSMVTIKAADAKLILTFTP